MDRRTRDSKLVGNTVASALREDLELKARLTAWEYFRAERCRICGLDERDWPNSTLVRLIIDRELMRNATYKAALDAIEPFVAQWPPDQRPTYTAVRNHAKRHLKRDQALVRQLMEAHAVDAGVDVEQGEGSILTPEGVLALIAQKGYEQVRDGEAAPTIGETIAASRALNAAETERLRDELDEERQRVRVLITVLEEISPDALRSLTGSRPELSAKSDVIVLPEAGANDPAAIEEEPSGYKCEECNTVAKSRGGLLQHKRRKHSKSSPAGMGPL
ncbi:MAG TPA: hypothetical protein VFI35_09510 [Actinomycetota bacterium]|nr:hypothetical protein [Actinomycetota bacterium]